MSFENPSLQRSLFCPQLTTVLLFSPSAHPHRQWWTDNSWSPRAIGDHGAPVSLPKLKKAYEKGTRGISWGPLLTPGPRAVPEFPNGQSAPAHRYYLLY
ncbi:unnamed protein product, partial [Staurois parvus]